jgi:hypothetical protein
MSGDGEQTVGVIPNAKRMKSMGRYDSFALVVTTRRMIVAQLTSEMLTKAANDARENAKSEGKGFFAAWGAQLKTAFTYSGKYLEMPPDSIIAETRVISPWRIVPYQRSRWTSRRNTGHQRHPERL